MYTHTALKVNLKEKEVSHETLTRSLKQVRGLYHGGPVTST
jgi:hypothetical protein